MWIERLMAGISHQHVLSYNPFLHILNQQRIVDTADGNMYNNEIVKVALNADKISICGLNRK